MKPVHAWILITLVGLLAGCTDGQTPNTAGVAKGGDHEREEHSAEYDAHEQGSQHADEHGHDEAAAGSQLARITPAAAAAAGINVMAAGPHSLRDSLPLYGVIAPNAERTRNVSARYAGVVKTVGRTLGDAVRAGGALATIESNDSLQVYTVTAPISGTITARNVNEGESVSDQPLFTITDLSSVWVDLSAFPRDMVKIRPGQIVQVKATDGGLSGTGRIALVSAVGTTATQSTNVRVVLDNARRQWTPGLYVAAEVVLSEAAVPIAVKSTALQDVDGQRVVFVQKPDGFEPRGLRLGRSDGEMTEVLEGLTPGEHYVTDNSFVVKAELEKGSAEHDH
jgi:cobalt-zinc-cadmium efflux system membrane fusion protein